MIITLNMFIQNCFISFAFQRLVLTHSKCKKEKESRKTKLYMGKLALVLRKLEYLNGFHKIVNHFNVEPYLTIRITLIFNWKVNIIQRMRYYK